MKLNNPKRADSISAFLGPQWAAQPKLDGVRLAVVYAADGRYGLTKGGQRAEAPEGLPDMPVGTVVDGELVGEGTWESALSALRVGGGSWVPFDLVSNDPFPERLAALRAAGFMPVEAGPVNTVWERALYDGLEGVVVRNVAGAYHSPAFKIKVPKVLNCIAHRGFLHVLDDGKPKAVARCSPDLTGRVRVECEGVTTYGNLRAARVLGPAIPKADVSVEQFRRIHGARPHRASEQQV